MKTKKTNKMNTVISINWKIRDLIREKLSFANWHKGIFGVPASRKALKKIEENDNELAEMKKEVLAARDKAAA